MNCISVSRTLVSLVCLAVFSLALQAQPANPGIAPAPSTQGLPSNVISFSDTLPGQPDGAITVTFSLYPDQQSTTATWVEDQVVQIASGKYTVLLGSATTNGIPPVIFAADQAHWLGVQINGTEKRYLLVSVPYAMKALEADRLGGLGASQYVTTAQLQAALQTAVSAPASTTNTGTKTVSGPTPNASLNPAQPATDFTDNNTSEVLLVTQQGTGFAIHAISAGDAALFAENSNATGTAVKAVATSTTGNNIGILGQTASSDGIAAVFDNTAGGSILSLRNNGNQVVGVNQRGDINTLGFILAAGVSGDGSGLFNIQNSATTATTASTGNTIVLRDNAGGITGNQIFANNYFAGSGQGLFNIPNSATTATTANNPNSIVLRDNAGGINVNGITASFISGNGAGLFNIPNSATTATPVATANTIVQRDSSGGFAANSVISNFFSGNGAGLFNIPNSATSATSAFTPNTIVARDANGSFSAMSITTNSLNMFAGGLTNSGFTDFSAGSQTSPVHAVLSANTPGGCNPSKELLIKTDATPGQQLFICNATGNGWVLVGDGATGSVTSVASGDGSISVGGPSAAPVISVANGGITATKLAPNAVSAANIAPGSITGVQLAPATITSSNIASGAIGNAQLAANAVTGANIANGSISNAQLATNAVTSGNIADGALTPAKIAGTAATLGANNFAGIQSIVGGLSVNADVSITGLNNSSIFLTTHNPVGIQISSSNTINPGIAVRSDNDGIDTSSNFGIALNAESTSTQGTGVFAIGGKTGVQAQSSGVALSATSVDTSGTGTAAVLTNLAQGKILSALLGSTEVFNVDTSGNMLSNGALYTKFPSGGTVLNGPVTLQSGLARASLGVDSQGGVIGIAITSADSNGNVAVAYSGVANCAFDGVNGLPQPGDFAGISRGQRGACTDLGLSPQPGAQVLGRILLPANKQLSILAPVLLVSTQGDVDPTISINTGAGLTGGPITSNGTISIAGGGITNSMLAPNAVTSANIAIGSITSTHLAANAVTSASLAPNAVTSANIADGSLSPAKITGTAATLGANTFTDVQTMPALNVNGDVSATGNIIASFIGSTSNAVFQRAQATTLAVGTTTLTSTALSTASSNLALSAVGFGVQSTAINAITSGDLTTAISATVAGNQSTAGVFVNGGFNGSILSGQIGSGTEVFNVDTAGNVFSGGGQIRQIPASLLTRSPIGLLAKLDNNGNATLTNPGDKAGVVGVVVSISGTTGLRVAYAGTASCLFDNQPNTLDYVQISAIIVGECTDVGPTYPSSGQVIGRVWQLNPQGGAYVLLSGADQQGFSPTNINIATGAGLTGGPITGSGTISIGAGAVTNSMLQNNSVTLTPGTGLSGGGSAALGGSVTLNNTGALSFNGRNGNVSPASGDYSFGQISGSLATSQLPALTGDVTEAAGSGIALLTTTGVTPGAYSKVSVDLKGRVLSGSQASFSDLTGAATPSQLPVFVVYNNQVNTFNASQAVNGSMSATFFIGNGGGLTNVNAATLNNVPSTSFAQLGATSNAFTGGVSAPSFAGDGSALTNVNAATVNNLQMLKLTASITPANVSSQACSEQSFTVSGVNSTDTILSLQPSGHGVGTNIAIGGWRVTAANTVAVQFCNVSRNNSTPTAGTYTIAVMR